MAENSNPFIKLGDGANAPILNYSIPESTNYVGTAINAIDISMDFLNEDTQRKVRENLASKIEENRDRPYTPPRTTNQFRIATGLLKDAEIDRNRLKTFFEEKPGTYIVRPIETLTGFAKVVDIVPTKPRDRETAVPRPKILFFERMQISNFLGDYGAGRVVKTFSLFPGEKTKISIRSYQKTTEKSTYGSSILDSTSEEAAADFENSLASESTTKQEDYEAEIINHQRDYESLDVDASVSANVGPIGGSASVSVSTVDEHERSGEWGTRKARENTANIVSNALQKHASKSSSKRDIEINTSTERSQESESETSIERVIENVNVSRTLNLVFRQMVQEFISIIHLTDVKFALYDEKSGPYPQYSIHELDKFLDDYFAHNADIRTIIRTGIIRELYYIFNYNDEPVQFLEQKKLNFPQRNVEGLEISLPENINYFRVKKDEPSKLKDREYIKVQGVILKVNYLNMRTDGVVVDAFLGQGEALDDYSQGLQRESVREAFINNNLKEREIEKIDIAKTILENNDMNKAEVFEKLFPCCLNKKGNIIVNNNSVGDDE